jgi:hypothetical protein
MVDDMSSIHFMGKINAKWDVFIRVFEMSNFRLNTFRLHFTANAKSLPKNCILMFTALFPHLH